MSKLLILSEATTSQSEGVRESKDRLPSQRHWRIRGSTPITLEPARIPFDVHLTASGYEVLRLRKCFAERSSYSAQDDRS